MHLTVGYLATPTGDDGVALAGALAKTFDADVDVVLVVRDELPDGHPGRGRVPGNCCSSGASSGSPGPSPRWRPAVSRRRPTVLSASPSPSR